MVHPLRQSIRIFSLISPSLNSKITIILYEECAPGFDIINLSC